MLHRQARAICLAGAVISMSLGYYQLLRGGSLHSVLEYDDGIYFGSAVRLAHGFLPYRNYVLVHPPGITLALAPLGLLSRMTGTHVAFEMARLTTPLVEGAGVFCAGWLVRHRRGASAVACLIMAVWADSVQTERTVMLEPYCVLACLVALLVLFEGDHLTRSAYRVLWAGALFGIAASFELFALFPYLVVVAALAVSTPRRRLITFVTGSVAGAAAVCGPFFIMAPGAFVRDILTAQLSRTQVVQPSIWDRLLHLLGFPEASAYPTAARVIVVLLIGTFVLSVLRAAALRAARSDTVSPLELCALGMTLLSTVCLLDPPAFYYHYAAFDAPLLALLLSLAVARLGLRFAAGMAGCLLVLGTLHAVRFIQTHTTALPVRSAAIEALVPSGACVLSDDPSNLLLTNRFTGSAACDPAFDTYATSFVQNGGEVRPAGPASDRYWIGQFSRVDYLQLIYGFSLTRIPWDSQLIGYVKSHFELVSRSAMLYAAKGRVAGVP